MQCFNFLLFCLTFFIIPVSHSLLYFYVRFTFLTLFLLYINKILYILKKSPRIFFSLILLLKDEKIYYVCTKKFIMSVEDREKLVTKLRDRAYVEDSKTLAELRELYSADKEWQRWAVFCPSCEKFVRKDRKEKHETSTCNFKKPRLSSAYTAKQVTEQLTLCRTNTSGPALFHHVYLEHDFCIKCKTLQGVGNRPEAHSRCPHRAAEVVPLTDDDRFFDTSHLENSELCVPTTMKQPILNLQRICQAAKEPVAVFAASEGNATCTLSVAHGRFLNGE